MHTSFLALCLFVAPILAAPQRPAWLHSYGDGLEAGQKQGKPVAVFVGTGSEGKAALVKEGQFSDEQLQQLAQSYVCVYLDRSQAANQQVVRELGITRAGMVISDRTGTYQAFHQDGAISQADLSKHLSHFGNPNLVVSTTVSNTARRTSYYDGGGSSGFSTQPFAPAVRTANC